MRRTATLVAGALAVGAVSTSATASPPSAPTTSLSFVAAPIFGAEAATGSGWNEIVARLDNGGETAQRGVLELTLTQTWSSGEPEIAARAPFVVPKGQSAVLSIPTRGFSYYAPQVTLTAKTLEGRTIQSVTVPFNGSAAPLLVEVEEPARLSYALRGWPIDSKWTPGTSPAGNNALTVGSPGFDRATGDPILPEHVSGYGAATVVVIRSNRLIALDAAKRDALVGWVNGGGTLAIAVSRPEDLRTDVMTSLVGGEARPAPVPASLLLLPAFPKPAPSTLGDDDAPTGGGPAKGSPSRAHDHEDETHAAVSIGPPAALRDHLRGHTGGDLRPSDFGATALRGLGEVHLLAFDPTVAQASADPWVDTRMIAMVGRAWDRRARVAFPVGGGDRSGGSLDGVRRALDPNENFRLALGISAMLLVLYSIVVGPLVFARAAKRKKPLAPLLWVPAWSAVAFASIVVVGLMEKGWRGRSRHLTFLEAGSASTRASLRSYRGFFANETQSLSIPSLQRASVLEVEQADGLTQHQGHGALRIDRDQVTLGEVTSLPWQTVIVREDGLVDVGGGISLIASRQGGLDVVNESGHALKDVIVREAHDSAYFATIANGARVALSQGRPVFGIGGPPTMTASFAVHPLASGTFRPALGPDGKRIAEMWAPLEGAAGDAVDWWPEDAPVLIATLDAPPSRTDSGLALESDRILVRVVGATGAP